MDKTIITCDQCSLTVAIPTNGFPFYCNCGNVVHKDGADKPALSQRLKTFAKATAKHASSGFKRTAPEILETRKAECAKCEHNNGRSCNKCGCQLVGWPNKLEWASESCPVGKW